MNKLFSSNKVLSGLFLLLLLLAPQTGSAQKDSTKTDNRFELSKNLMYSMHWLKKLRCSMSIL